MSASPPPNIPRLPAFDSSIALRREGYLFVSNRCESLGSDMFRTRIMLHDVVCMRGVAAAEQFYQSGRFTRRGAIPRTAVALLQDWGSVQTLDGAAHHHRKQLFMDMMDDDSLARAVSIFQEEWQQEAARWTGRRIVLYEAVRPVLARTAIRWCGIPLEHSNPARRTAELSAMIDGAASLGPRYLRARLLRRRCEQWTRSIIGDIREGRLPVPPECPAGRIALHHELSGEVLPPEIAAVELINLLRPVVAVARFIVFSAHALHVHWNVNLRLSRESPQEDIRSFVQEVRRFYPFFPMVGGRVLKAFSWRDHHFKVNDWVLLDLYGTNRHPAAWPDPHIFEPGRFLGWEGDAHALIAQGGGNFLKGHRCPGEWLTIALTMEAVRQLLAMDYTVPDQDLEIPLNRLPALPRSGFILAQGSR